MVKLILSLAFALTFVALPVAANPIITVNTAGHSSFHPAKMHLALSGLGNRFEMAKFHGDFGFSGSTWENGSAMVDFSPPKPDFRVPSIPEPTTLLLFGLFAMVLVMRSRWATWHR